jgi:TonB family protein
MSALPPKSGHAQRGAWCPLSAKSRLVSVSFAIGASGSLRNALVARSSGKAPLDRAALGIIRQAAPFSPPRGSGQTITISFR